MPDHIHLCLSIPPKYSVAYTSGFLKRKSADRIHRELLHEFPALMAARDLPHDIPTSYHNRTDLSG